MEDQARCKGCGMVIEWIRSPKDPNKRIPAQRIRVVYRRVGASLEKIDLPDEIFVNHFETCPDAKKFTRRGK
jgi:hypothetical protein